MDFLRNRDGSSPLGLEELVTTIIFRESVDIYDGSSGDKMGYQSIIVEPTQTQVGSTLRPCYRVIMTAQWTSETSRSLADQDDGIEIDEDDDDEEALLDACIPNDNMPRVTTHYKYVCGYVSPTLVTYNEKIELDGNVCELLYLPKQMKYQTTIRSVNGGGGGGLQSTTNTRNTITKTRFSNPLRATASTVFECQNGELTTHRERMMSWEGELSREIDASFCPMLLTDSAQVILLRLWNARRPEFLETRCMGLEPDLSLFDVVIRRIPETLPLYQSDGHVIDYLQGYEVQELHDNQRIMLRSFWLKSNSSLCMIKRLNSPCVHVSEDMVYIESKFLILFHSITFSRMVSFFLLLLFMSHMWMCVSTSEGLFLIFFSLPN
jgi:hypothetical protein